MSGVSDYTINAMRSDAYYNGNLLVEPLNRRITGVELHLRQDGVDFTHNTVNEVWSLHFRSRIPK